MKRNAEARLAALAVGAAAEAGGGAEYAQGWAAGFRAAVDAATAAVRARREGVEESETIEHTSPEGVVSTAIVRRMVES